MKILVIQILVIANQINPTAASVSATGGAILIRTVSIASQNVSVRCNLRLRNIALLIGCVLHAEEVRKGVLQHQYWPDL